MEHEDFLCGRLCKIVERAHGLGDTSMVLVTTIDGPDAGISATGYVPVASVRRDGAIEALGDLLDEKR